MNYDALVSIICGGFLVLSPLTSYLDTVLNIYKTKSSAGFSLDVCGIMLISSILKVFFYFGRPYEYSLYLQSWIMIAIQVVLLKFALDHRPKQWNGGPLDETVPRARPFKFWEWDDSGKYWKFLARFSACLAVLQLVIGKNLTYVELVGFVGLVIEAFLPMPQILTNAARGSVEGFRPSLLLSWIGGDLAKLWFFAFSRSNGSDGIALQFIICAVVQGVLDLFVGVQYYMYSSGRWKGSSSQQIAASRQRANSLKEIELGQRARSASNSTKINI